MDNVDASDSKEAHWCLESGWRIPRAEDVDELGGGQLSGIQFRKILGMACQSPTTEHRTHPLVR